jgi:hypothetical protein
MSGPKKSSWQIERETQRRLAAERRMEKEAELLQAIEDCELDADSLRSEFGHIAESACDNVNEWMEQARAAIDGDIRQGWRQVNGAQKYLARTRASFEERAERARTREAERSAAAAEQAARVEHQMRSLRKLDPFLGRMESLLATCPALDNEGARQRFEIIATAVKRNPENPNTAKQAMDLCDRLEKIAEEYEQRQQERRYVSNAFSGILGCAPSPAGGACPESVTGSIAGMPLTVHFDKRSGAIRIDTPEKGDCKNALKTLAGQLGKRKIALGPVSILRTGEIWNPAKSIYDHDLSVNA